MGRRLGLGKNNHLTYASLALNPRNVQNLVGEEGILTFEPIHLHKFIIMLSFQGCQEINLSDVDRNLNAWCMIAATFCYLLLNFGINSF